MARMWISHQSNFAACHQPTKTKSSSDLECSFSHGEPYHRTPPLYIRDSSLSQVHLHRPSLGPESTNALLLQPPNLRSAPTTTRQMARRRLRNHLHRRLLHYHLRLLPDPKKLAGRAVSRTEMHLQAPELLRLHRAERCYGCCNLVYPAAADVGAAGVVQEEDCAHAVAIERNLCDYGRHYSHHHDACCQSLGLDHQ